MKKKQNTVVLIGETLIMLQKMEAIIKGALILSLNSPAEVKFQKFLKEDRKTFGMLIRLMETKIELPEDFDTGLSELLHFRNLFVHKLFMQEWFDLNTQEGLDTIDSFLKNILNKSAIAIRIFIAFAIKAAGEAPTDNKLLFDKIVERIVQTAPQFGSDEFDKYFDNLMNDVKNNYKGKISNK